MKKTSLLLSLFALFATNIFAQWTNGMDAEFVIGQPDFNLNPWGVTDATFQYPYDVAIDLENGKMYVADLVNHRVLRFAYPITGNQPSAELVFGQPDMFSNGFNRDGTTAVNSLCYPSAVVVRNGTLWICDNFNNRILKFYDAANITINGPDADGVLGQTGFTTNSSGVSQSGLSDPYDITFDNTGNLWVADMQNCRILKFNDADNKSNGANADGVLGQANFTTNLNGTSQSQLMFPLGVVSDGTNLFVSDFQNSRILIFRNASEKANGANADVVLGQANFTLGNENRGNSTCAANTLSSPSKPEINAEGTLFVSDQNNNRVLIFEDAVNKTNGADANYVLGKTDFITNDFGEVDQNHTCFPNGSAYDNTNHKLVLADEENNRLLQFSYYAEPSPPVAVDDEWTLPGEFMLAQNFPNPFNPATTISFYIPQECHVSLRIYTILGNELIHLVNEIRPSGRYQIKFNAENLPTGIYLYQLTAGNFSKAKQMLLLK